MNKILITGGAGFIGTNTALYFAKKNWKIIILDNLSRKGSELNLKFIKSLIDIDFYNIDIRNEDKVMKCIKEAKPDFIIHLASQVAVTHSIDNPRVDFEINAIGTFNLLEAIRLINKDIFFINASTNKIYGKLEHHKIKKLKNKYVYIDLPFGISEHEKIDFYSPYGCSKGVEDQYTIDYSRIYNLKTVSFRQSCVYGIRQFGVEDQGWVAWFSIAAYFNKKISIYGDGFQTRDILYVDDLARLYEITFNNKEKIKNGDVFNVGGGEQNAISLLELLEFLQYKNLKKINYSFFKPRLGDQEVYISDINKLNEILKWKPKVLVKDGIDKLLAWIDENNILISSILF